MKCENCENEHNGEYGSGRFCSQKCSRSFSTKTSREETNRKVSDTLKRKYKNGELHKSKNSHSFKKGFDPNRRKFSKEDLEKSKIAIHNKHLEYVNKTPFEKLHRKLKKRIVLSEQNEKCICGINEWCGKKLTLQLDHIDGNRNNEYRENLRALCPNCHSLTETYAGKNSFKKTVTDDELLEALRLHKNVHQALKSLGLNNGRNYVRAQKMVVERGLEPLKS